MTDISVKNRIIALASFAFAALILTIRSVLPFTFVFFGCIGLVIFFSDKILNSEKIKNRTVFAFFVSAACYHTFYQIFFRVHDNNKQLMAASAIALFLAAVFAATDIKNLPYSILAAVLICFLDMRIAASYGLLLLTFSIVKFQLELKGNKFRKNQGKKKKSKKKSKDSKENPGVDPFFVVIVSIIVCIVCLCFCIDSVFKNEIRTAESIDYILKQFKNTFGILILIVYLLIKLMRSEIKAKISIIAGLVLNIAPIPLYLTNYGWSFVSLFIISTTLFLVLVCLESGDIIDSIKEDFRNHKYLCLTELLLLLQ